MLSFVFLVFALGKLASAIQEVQFVTEQPADLDLSNTLYNPCPHPHLRYDKKVDIARLAGLWYNVQTTFPTPNGVTPAQMQALIKKYVGCANQIVVVNNRLRRQLRVIGTLTFRQPVPPDTHYAWANETLWNTKQMAYPNTNGDNGHWLLVYKNETSGVTHMSDLFIVNIYYKSFYMWYRCETTPQGVVQPQWGLARRVPKPYGSIQTRYFKAYASQHGIHTSDSLYKVPMDKC